MNTNINYYCILIIGGIGNGSMYFMEKELFDADSRLPSKKQKYNHSKPFHFSEILSVDNSSVNASA